MMPSYCTTLHSKEKQSVFKTPGFESACPWHHTFYDEYEALDPVCLKDFVMYLLLPEI
jgi:hypothetical protein